MMSSKGSRKVVGLEEVIIHGVALGIVIAYLVGVLQSREGCGISINRECKSLEMECNF
jgi:hypothetical protein